MARSNNAFFLPIMVDFESDISSQRLPFSPKTHQILKCGIRIILIQTRVTKAVVHSFFIKIFFWIKYRTITSVFSNTPCYLIGVAPCLRSVLRGVLSFVLSRRLAARFAPRRSLRSIWRGVLSFVTTRRLAVRFSPQQVLRLLSIDGGSFQWWAWAVGILEHHTSFWSWVHVVHKWKWITHDSGLEPSSSLWIGKGSSCFLMITDLYQSRFVSTYTIYWPTMSHGFRSFFNKVPKTILQRFEKMLV